MQSARVEINPYKLIICSKWRT